ncbi:MAG: ABC transporter permease [Fimbriimonadales bacterium]|nr:ABC transporter permease [Fimbriimonadales bacterium]
MNELLDLVSATARLGGPLALAAMGGLLSERSGVVNIALEGAMLASACACGMVSAATGSTALGLFAGLVAAVIVCLLHALAVLGFRIDHIVSGIAANAVAFGVTGFAIKVAVQRGAELKFTPLPQIVYIACALILPVVIAFMIQRTVFGLRINAVGNSGSKSAEMGVNPIRVRLVALFGCGLLTGLAGAMLVSQPEHFTANMTAGKGFIALAALILGGWRPIPAMIAAFAFGLFDALQIRLQGTPMLGVEVPSQFWASLPYVITLIALAGFLGKSKPPAALGRE